MDTNIILQPKEEDPLPNMPDREDAQLKAHLYQALRAMGADDNSITSPGENPISGPAEVVQESYIYGSDVDSVDVATRVALIRFFDSPGVLRGSNKHMRTLRLYPRPVVAFQADCFLQERLTYNSCQYFKPLDFYDCSCTATVGLPSMSHLIPKWSVYL